MSLTSAKRLRKEMHKLQTSPPDEDIRMSADEDDIRQWRAYIRGPPDTPFAGGIYELKITVGQQYPMVPPCMRFVTKVFHPNVHFNTGEICLNILKKDWSPAWSLQGACRAILALLAHPEADSPLNCDAGNMVRAGDMRAFRSVARLYNEELASKDWPADF
ncbi:conserved unknown protein [Ectocarpus siliculosus]|uniref:UBC core domain-containing protein n=1 Tax=Ectocarpus siliculosus TaxID=2880 RepID=D7FXX6_ECTSI|nr:conserved unknown protein [Ectocarpus siliculosus]|eukprot:CBJ32389.1 conserved unknown protein [Ectocarpus siliculosus]